MLRKEMQDKFSISSSKVDDAVFSLTHKKMLNLKNYEGNTELLEYYCEIGRRVFDILLQNFIRNEYTKQTNKAMHCLNYSRQFFLDKFFIIYDLQKYIICEIGVDNWGKLKDDIIRQFIGFLYLETSYENLHMLFSKVFSKNEIIVTNDYNTVLNILLKGKKLEFKEIGKSGPDNEAEFIYELLFNGHKVVATGKSKKTAKHNCAEEYCKRFLTKEEILSILGFTSEPRKRYEYIITDKTKSEIINKIAYVLDVEKNNVKICFTHVSVSNKYKDENNSSMVSLGASVEYLYLHRFIYEQLQIKDMRLLKKLVTLLHTNQKVYMEINKRFNVDKAIYMMSADSLGAIEAARNDTIKSLFFITFMKENISVFKDDIFDIYSDYLKQIDFRFIEPCTFLQEFLQDYGVTELKYFVTSEKELSYESKIILELCGCVFTYDGQGKTKKQANSKAAKAFLEEIYDSLDYVLLANEDLNNVNNMLIEPLLLIMMSKVNKFKSLIREKEYLGYSHYINCDINGFITKLSETIRLCINLLSNEANIQINGFLRDIFNEHSLYERILNEVIIQDLWDYCEDNKNNKPYSFSANKERLLELSMEVIKEKVSQNGLFISKIENPGEELQLISVINNKKAFYYIKEPADATIQYMYDNDKNFSLDMNSEKNLDFLKKLKKKELYEFKDKVDENKCNHFVLEPKCFDIYIKALFEIFDIEKLLIAVGFAYSSGLKLIENEIHSLLNKHKPLKMIIGSLQEYLSGKDVKTMDKKTALYINGLINKGCKIETYENSFYHGKTYIFLTHEYTITIMGSTNLSRNAFRNNKELDSIFIYPRHDINPFLKWYDDFVKLTSKIEYLDISKFSEMYIDVSERNSRLQNLSEQGMKKRISNVPDDMLRERLLLWLEYKPSNIYDNIIVADKDYIAIEFSEKAMIVLETFLPGNSYFVFYNVDIFVLINMIAEKTKSEIFEMSDMEKRGYHVREKLTLELNVKSYFLNI